MANVDLEQAEKVFRQAIKETMVDKWEATSPVAAEIGEVILGSHLTFRYILLNSLLAKATEENINPITLQAGSKLKGAYDARSLCHKVLVPLERELLNSRLGGSNEPFLNKPARFPELSEHNPVRAGKDRETLFRLIGILSKIPNSEYAYQALKDAIYFVLRRPTRDITQQITREGKWCSTGEIYDFIVQFMGESMEGETCALVGGVAFDLLDKIAAKKLDVHVHPINQSGSSSKEVSDIDVYYRDTLEYTIEVKDKQFSRQDVAHAVSKAIEARHTRLLFLTGPRGSLSNGDQVEIEKDWIEKGFDLVFEKLDVFLKIILSLTGSLTSEEIMELFNKHAQVARVKDGTMAHLISCAQEMDWIPES